jgi:serine/threonine-protein kinase
VAGKPDRLDDEGPRDESSGEPRRDANSEIRPHRENVEPTLKVENPSDAATYDEWPGRVLDERYQIVELLGEGGMGAVFVAEHLRLHKKEVAIKVIRPEFAGNGEIAARFAREAMATAQFEHSNVASAIDYGTLPEGGAYLVMQLVRGEPLSVLLEREGALHWSRAADIGAQLADALSAAASHRIVHRDLKPDNIIIQRLEDGGDLVKILDFGIARQTRDSILPPPPGTESLQQNLTREGTVVGTPGYMAPEQAVGDRVSGAADIYALGVVIWQCVAGRRLWTAGEVSSIVKRQLTEPVPPLAELLPDQNIPAELDRLLARMLAVLPTDRPSQPGMVRDILRQLAFSPGTSGTDTTPPGTAPAVEPHVEETGPPSVRAPEVPSVPDQLAAAIKEPRGILFLAGVGVFAIFLLVVTFVMVWTGEDPVENARALPEAVKEAAEKPAKQAMEPMKKAIAPIEKAVVEPIANVIKPVDEETTERPEPPAPLVDDEGRKLEPASLAPHVKPLMEAEGRTERVAAAEAVLAHEPVEEVPRYLLAVARLNMAKTCSEKKKVLTEITALGDVRALPALLKLSRRPEQGCGKNYRRDCIGCLRRDLRNTIRLFESGSLP